MKSPRLTGGALLFRQFSDLAQRLSLLIFALPWLNRLCNSRLSPSPSFCHRITTQSPMSPKKQLLLFFIAGLLLVTFHAYYYYLFVADDSFISFRYVDRLLNGQGLTWTEGRPVEGYSNLLWILVLAAVKRLTHGELWVIALFVNYLCSIASLWLLLKIMARLTQGNPTAMGWSMVLFAMSAPIAIWINGGLEAPLIMVLLMAALYYIMPFDEQTTRQPPEGNTKLGVGLTYAQFRVSFRRLAGAGIFCGLIALTRPDGILFAWAITLALLVFEYLRAPRDEASSWYGRRVVIIRRFFWPLFLFNIITVLFYTGQLLFRLHYYGEWVPNTALVKIGFTLSRVTGGLVYAARMLAAFVPFIVLLLLAFRRNTRNRAVQAFFLTIIAVISFYLVLIGGDIFPGYRHVLPLIPLLCAAAGITMMDVKDRTLKKKAVYYPAAFLLLLFVFGVQFADNRNRDGKHERWEWNCMGLGQTLQKGFHKEQPYMATTAAGALPYYAGLPTLDMLGLNDYYLPRHPPADFGKGYIGHELGDADYYLRQSPDIFFLYGRGSALPYFSAEKILFNTSSFKTEYERVRLLYHLEHRLLLPNWQPGTRHSVILSDSCYMFIKNYSNRIGIRVNNQRQLIIPSYFLKNSRLPDSSATTYLNKTSEFVISIAPGESYFLDQDRLRSLLKHEAVPAKSIVAVADNNHLLQLSNNENQLVIYNAGAMPVECKEIRIQL